ncbi:NUDIX domain-containing protein [Micromonospora sp. URMC 105]|uniref:NUDIX domain-containing protein n=1 Tax=Micromonospora sp. URMC 105 TaxID=3423413 RepID=UPI003F1C036D
MHVVVTGALVENGAVLLVHRSPIRRAYPDLWDLPGGHVEAGESELQALAREMREELGVHIVAESSSRLGYLHAGSGEDAVRVGVWHIGDRDGSPTNRAPDEHDDIAWVGISELRDLPLVFGDLAALVRSLPEPDRLPRRDEARTAASPSGPETIPAHRHDRAFRRWLTGRRSPLEPAVRHLAELRRTSVVGSHRACVRTWARRATAACRPTCGRLDRERKAADLWWGGAPGRIRICGLGIRRRSRMAGRSGARLVGPSAAVGQGGSTRSAPVASEA